MQPAETYHTVIITGIREEAKGVTTFTVAAEGEPIAFAAGQFITLVFQHHGKEERRSFSISSAPHEGQLSFTVKRVDNGAYSRLLTDRAKVGDKLQTIGAAGRFTIPIDVDRYLQVFFFTAGIGITPVFSLIKEFLHYYPGKQLVLVYSNSRPDDTVFRDEIKTLEQQYPDTFRAIFLYSNAFDLSRARLSKELVPRLLKEEGKTAKHQMFFYTCGPYSYMRMVIYALEEWGITEEQIKRENFNTNDRVIQRNDPPDKEPHKVTIRHQGQQYELLVQYPETILQAAKRNGIALPYSCEVGRCGSCAARCTSGKVWLSYNEVLMDVELKHGSILTCTGYPVGGDVTIEA